VAVTDPQLARVLGALRAAVPGEIGGTRITATIPLTERLLNELIAAALPPAGAVRAATVHPQPHDRIGVRVKLARPEFLPPIGVTLTIERQPELPQSPFLLFRVSGLGGILGLAGSFLSLDSMLPPGIRLQSDLLTVDVAAMLAHHGQGQWLPYLQRLRVNSEAGRLLVDLEAAVR
jgi:hypothetical protein